MSLVGNRVESYRVELLTRTDASLGNLEGVTGGSLTWNANADLPGGGSVTLVETDQEINYSQDRVRVWWSVAGEPEWPMGVYVLAAPATQHSDAFRMRQITLIDKLVVVRDDLLLSTLQVPAGANIINAVVQQIQAAGENRIAHTDSTATLSNAMSWEPGTSRLRVINDLLTVAGYWALWTDRRGQFRVEPYVAPGDRAAVWDFSEGETAVHTPDWQYELALWEATNTVLMVSQAGADDSVFVAYAVDDNPASPTSTVSMGRPLNPIVEENVEASSQVDLQQQANRKLLDNSNVVGKLTVQHAALPVWFNEVVTFRSQGTDTRATITKMNLTLEPGSLVTAEWRQA